MHQSAANGENKRVRRRSKFSHALCNRRRGHIVFWNCFFFVGWSRPYACDRAAGGHHVTYALNIHTNIWYVLRTAHA